VFLHSIWAATVPAAASVRRQRCQQRREGEKAADESSSLLCLRRVVKGHSFRQRRKGTAAVRVRMRRSTRDE